MSFAILDTNHLREFVGGSVAGAQLRKRIQEESADVLSQFEIVNKPTV